MDVNELLLGTSVPGHDCRDLGAQLSSFLIHK